MDVYKNVPYLAILEKRRDLLPKKVDDEDLLKEASGLMPLFLKEPFPLSPALFFILANLSSFYHLERFALANARLSIPAFKKGHSLLDKHFPAKLVVPLPEFLSVPRPFEEIKLYHLEVNRGKVFLHDKIPFYRASLLYASVLRWLKEKVRPNALLLRDILIKYIKVSSSKKKSPFIKKLIEAEGIPDGRKRILLYWLIPYWVNIEERDIEEVVELAREWVSRQGGRVYDSWLRSDAQNVKAKGIKPWSLEKVSRIDPELIKILKEVGVLD